MAKKSALNLLISKTCVGLVNGMSGWKQSSRTRLANFLASVTWYVLARRRKIALTNLRLCFPEWSEQKRVETAKGVFRNLIRAALDHSVLAKGSEAQVLEMVKFEGKEQFEELCAYVNDKIRENGTRILGGEMEKNPYKLKQRTACDYCSFKEICGFDEKQEGNSFRRLPTFSDEELWKKMREKGEKKDGNEVDTGTAEGH